MKKILGLLLGFVACFAFVLTVYAGTAKLTYKEYHRVTVDSMGTNFTTKAVITSVSGTPTLETQVGRKMFNLIWYDSGSVTKAYTGSGTTTNTWSANGNYATRSTWTNITSGTSITGTFSLY